MMIFTMEFQQWVYKLSRYYRALVWNGNQLKKQTYSQTTYTHRSARARAVVAFDITSIWFGNCDDGDQDDGWEIKRGPAKRNEILCSPCTNEAKSEIRAIRSQCMDCINFFTNLVSCLRAVCVCLFAVHFLFHYYSKCNDFVSFEWRKRRPVCMRTWNGNRSVCQQLFVTVTISETNANTCTCTCRPLDSAIVDPWKFSNEHKCARRAHTHTSCVCFTCTVVGHWNPA